MAGLESNDQHEGYIKSSNQENFADYLYQNLDRDCFISILTFLTTKDLGRLALVNKKLNEYSNDDRIWKEKVQFLQLEEQPKPELNENWKSLYKRITLWTWDSNPKRKQDCFILSNFHQKVTRGTGGSNPALYGKQKITPYTCHFTIHISHFENWLGIGIAADGQVKINGGGVFASSIQNQVASCIWTQSNHEVRCTIGKVWHKESENVREDLKTGDKVKVWVKYDVVPQCVEYYVNGVIYGKAVLSVKLDEYEIYPCLGCGSGSSVEFVY